MRVFSFFYIELFHPLHPTWSVAWSFVPRKPHPPFIHPSIHPAIHHPFIGENIFRKKCIVPRYEIQFVCNISTFFTEPSSGNELMKPFIHAPLMYPFIPLYYRCEHQRTNRGDAGDSTDTCMLWRVHRGSIVSSWLWCWYRTRCFNSSHGGCNRRSCWTRQVPTW